MGLTIGGKSLEEFLGTVPTATAIQMLTSNGINPTVKGTTPYLDLGVSWTNSTRRAPSSATTRLRARR